MTMITQALQGGGRRDSDCRAFFESDRRRFKARGAVGLRANVLRERAGACPEHFIAHIELRHTFPDGFDHAGVIHADASVLWLA